MDTIQRKTSRITMLTGAVLALALGGTAHAFSGFGSTVQAQCANLGQPVDASINLNDCATCHGNSFVGQNSSNVYWFAYSMGDWGQFCPAPVADPVVVDATPVDTTPTTGSTGNTGTTTTTTGNTGTSSDDVMADSDDSMDDDMMSATSGEMDDDGAYTTRTHTRGDRGGRGGRGGDSMDDMAGGSTSGGSTSGDGSYASQADDGIATSNDARTTDRPVRWGKGGRKGNEG